MARHENRFMEPLDSSAGACAVAGVAKGMPPRAKASCLTQWVHKMGLPSRPKYLQGCGDGPCLQMMGIVV